MDSALQTQLTLPTPDHVNINDSAVCLLEQAFIKNPDMTIKDLLNSMIAELGENLVIRHFTRYLVGEPLPSEA